MSKLSTTRATKAVLNVSVGESLSNNLERARGAMQALQRGKTPKAHYGVGFSELGQMLAVFTPKRWALMARLRETGPLTTAELARELDRDYKNVHADVAALSEWLAVQRTQERRVHVPWSEMVLDMKLPSRLAA